MYDLFGVFVFFFFKQKTAYEMRISDWSSDVCSSDLMPRAGCGYAAKIDLSWDTTDYGVSNVVIRSGSARGYVIGRGGASGSIRLPVSKAGRDDLFLIDADTGTIIDIESIPRSRPSSWSPAPN